jgi:hypothetical protein
MIFLKFALFPEGKRHDHKQVTRRNKNVLAGGAERQGIASPEVWPS